MEPQSLPSHANAARAPSAQVVIVGAGFGGIEAARRLGAAGISTTLIDRQNHHLFQPLLYQVATAALSPSDIAAPVRSILRTYSSVDVTLGEVCAVDVPARRVRTVDGRAIAFDHLILAAGATHSYFGHDGWAVHAPGLKTIEDARVIRSRLLFAFEQAEIARDLAEQKRLMTTVIVGAGPTGVEMAGSIAELARFTLARDFRRIKPADARTVLVEAGDRPLAAFSEPLSAYGAAQLRALGVELKLGSKVEAIGEHAITVGGEDIPFGTAVWAAGVRATAVADWLGVEPESGGRVRVNPDLSVPGHDGVFVIGDAAYCLGGDGTPLPGLAQVAKQQGIYLGDALARRIVRGEKPPPFVFRDRGNVAIIGRHAAVFEAGRIKLKGRLAWLAWAIVHVYLLVGFQNRVLVSVQWIWRYLTYERGARLIADDPGARLGRALPFSEAAPRSEDNTADTAKRTG